MMSTGPKMFIVARFKNEFQEEFLKHCASRTYDIENMVQDDIDSRY